MLEYVQACSNKLEQEQKSKTADPSIIQANVHTYACQISYDIWHAYICDVRCCSRAFKIKMCAALLPKLSAMLLCVALSCVFRTSGSSLHVVKRNG